VIEISYKNVGDDPEFMEEIYQYAHSRLGKPEEGTMPEIYDILSEIKCPIGVPYFVQYLQQGMMIGAGWKLTGTVYDHPILARTEAYQRCKNLGTPTRVLIKLNKYKVLQPICVFFKKNDKVYVAIPSKDDKIITQEVMHQLDENGGEMNLERLQEFERNLGTQKAFSRVEY